MFAALFAVLTLVTAGLRFYLKFSLMDPTTGFYLLEGAQPWVTLFNLLLAATVVAVAVVVLRRKPEPMESGVINCKVAGICAVAAGFFVEVGAITSGFNLVMAAVEGYSFPVFTLLMDGLSLVAGLVLVCHGFAAVSGNGRFGRSGVIAVVAVVWGLLTMLTTFLSYSVVKAMSDNLLNTLALVCLVVFLLGYFKLTLGFSPAKSARLAAFGGLLLGYFALVGGAPRLASYFMKNTPMESSAVLQCAVLICLGLMGVAVAFRLLAARPRRGYSTAAQPFFES